MRRALLIALAALPAWLATPSRADETMPTFQIVMKNGRIEPTEIVIPANTRVKLLLRNEGPGAEEFESTDLKKEKVLAPGASSFLILAPLKPGTYRYFGDFHPQTSQGRIVVR
ncbi:cupredoxin domain-containing protein [Aquabacterium sp.]|uniref:cupredoxin domain-containing protein n=1 Tax=Aquabacterium sp. TaxID=1872578 RepID=UPI0035B326FA